MTRRLADGDLPDWALLQAQAELYDEPRDSERVRARAWQLANERSTLDREHHDEFDDPDSGGEG